MVLEPFLLGALQRKGFERMENERIMIVLNVVRASKPVRLIVFIGYCRLGKSKFGAMIRARQLT
jgi:electron transport complex protein RnfC